MPKQTSRVKVLFLILRKREIIRVTCDNEQLQVCDYRDLSQQGTQLSSSSDLFGQPPTGQDRSVTGVCTRSSDNVEHLHSPSRRRTDRVKGP